MARVGLYPGTFDPITNGHTDIIGRAVRLFDRLVIGVAVSRDKNPLFGLDQRIAMVKAETDRFAGDCVIDVLPMEGLLIDFAHRCGAGCVVRGLRAVADFEYEFQMTAMNQRLDPAIETVFFMADPRHQAIASRLVKEIARLGGDVNHFVSPAVARALKEKTA